jgi:HEAT repeat protein
VSPETAIDVVEAFDPAEPGAVLSLNEVVAAGSEAVPDLLPLLENEDPNRQFAALYVALLLTDTDEEIALVAPLLAHAEMAIRTMVAGALAGLGVVEALPVLIEAMSSSADLPFSDPPRSLTAFAQSALEAYTRESFADAPAWEAWWRNVESSLEWDGETYVER